MAAIDDLNLIPATQSDIYSKLFYIAKKYVNTDADFLRSGLFGYITESMAMIMRDSSIHKTILYNESFLNTAVMPKSIYNWAKMFNINITSATPSYADITITLSVNDFSSYRKPASDFSSSKYGAEVASLGNTNILIIDKGTPFIAGTYTFTLEHSILIQQRANGKGYTARYLLNEPNVTTAYQNLTTAILPVIFSSDGYGEEYISLQARVYQYRIETRTKIIASNSFIDRKIHEFEFSDQFVSAKIKYIKGSIEQDVHLFFSDIGVSYDGPYAFYNLTDQNKLQIKFADGLNTFKPAANSTLKVEIMTTKGADGNINYSGDVICRLSEESLRNLPLQVKFTSFTPSGGLNALNLSEIKQKIINEISTRDIIVTETDLNLYFETLTKLLETINSGKVRFIKKRDDILRRVFSAYILMRDLNTTNSNQYTVPTNTLDATSEIKSNTSIPIGAPIVATSEDKTKYEILLNDADYSNITDYYICPFYMYISLNPIRRVKYIYNLANDSTSLVYKSIDSSVGNLVLIPSSVSVKRGFNGNQAANSYVFTFTLTTDFDISTLKSLQSGSINLYFNSKQGSTTISSPTLNYPITSHSIIMESDELDESTGVRTSTIQIEIPVATDGAEFTFEEDNTSSTNFGSYITLMPTGTSGTSLTYMLPEQVIPVLEFKNLTMDSQTISMSFQADSPLTLFQNLDGIMSSDIAVNYSESTDDESVNKPISSITIKDIPLVHSSYITSQSNLEGLISQLFVYINMLKENVEKLETSTFFDLKFYNTHGISQYYNTTTPQLKLELMIRLKQNISVEENAEAIRNYIISLVDISNNDSMLKVSHIITATLNKFLNIIEEIEFMGLNGTFTQYVKKISRSNSDKLTYAPEYFNISKEFAPCIQICDYDGTVIDGNSAY